MTESEEDGEEADERKDVEWKVEESEDGEGEDACY